MNYKYRSMNLKRYNPYKFKAWNSVITLILFIILLALFGFILRRAEKAEAKSEVNEVVIDVLLKQRVRLADENHSLKTNKGQSFKKQITSWEEFTSLAHSLAPLYDYPVNVLLSQAALESARGTSFLSQDRNNFFGIGAYDSDPNQAFGYATPGEGIIEYMRLIKNHYPEAYAVRHNPEAMIKSIKGYGYATDHNYVSKVMSMEEWKR